jgi:hypothetical protein
MNLVAENAEYSLIQVIPREEIDKASFMKAWVKLDRKLYLLPSRIFLLGADGKSSKDFVLKLTKQAANREVLDVNFQGQEFPGWKVVRNPGGPAPAPAPAAGGGRAAQPAAVGAGAAAGAGTNTNTGATAPAQQPAMKSRIFGGRRN